MNQKSMFLKITTAALVIAAVIVLPNFDKLGAQSVPGGLSIDVQVKNLTRGENFQDSTNAQTGDLVQVQIRIAAVSGQTGIVVRNPLSTRLAFSTGESGVFNEGGVALGNMNGGTSRVLSFDAVVTGTQEGPIVNTAYARSRETSEHSDSAMINAMGIVLGVQTSNLILRNRMMNLTRGGTAFQDSVDASIGDRLRIEIYVESLAGTFQSGDRLNYVIPHGRFAVVTGDTNIIFYGMDLEGIKPNTPKTVTFEIVLVDGAENKLTSTARVMRGQAVQRDAAAIIFVRSAGATGIRNLGIDAKVLNLSRGETEFRDATSAQAGDRVRFQIKVDALGNISTSNITVKNALPSGLSFVSGDLNLMSPSGLSLGTMAAGESKTSIFDAQVGSGTGTITNTASVSSDTVASVSDSVQITMSGVAGVTTTAGQKTVTAMNRSLGQDATRATARPGDVIAFQFIYRNTSAVAENVRIEADIKDVMQLARVSNTGGAVVDAGMIRFPAMNLAPNGEIIQTFEVTVLDNAHVSTQADRIMALTYGSQLLVQVTTSQATAQVAGTSTIQPPRTGASENLVALLSLLATGGYWFYRRKYKFILE